MENRTTYCRLGALSAGGDTKRRIQFEPLLSNFSHVASSDWYRNPYGDPIYYANLFEEEIMLHGEDQVAAIILEPVTGASNAASYSPTSYDKRIREICDQYDILLIFDEVMSGFGRTGKLFTCNHFEICPDLLICGKGISGGYSPLAVALVSEKVFNTFLKGSGQFYHGHTHVGNPVSASAGL